LQAAGYQTLLAGKYLSRYPCGAALSYIPPGWSEWYSLVQGNGNAPGEFNYTLNENGTLVSYGNTPEDYGTDGYGRQAVDFIQRMAQAENPFFVYLAPYALHEPLTAAPRHADLFPGAKAPRPPSFNEGNVSDKAQYIRNRPLLNDAEIAAIDQYYRQRLQALQAVDEMVAHLITTLSVTGQLDHTYIFFTSDNGFHLGQHRLLTGKRGPYEEDIRVTLLVRGPGVPAGKMLAHLTGNIRANALKSLSQHHLEQVLGIQCTGEAFAGQTLLAGVLPQEIERDVAQHGKVLGTVVLAEPTLIFPKGDIERPMEPVLNAPVVAHGAGKLLCVRFQASEVEALLYRSLPG